MIRTNIGFADFNSDLAGIFDTLDKVRIIRAQRNIAGKFPVIKIKTIETTVIRSLHLGSSLCTKELAGIYWPRVIPFISGILFLPP